MRKITNHVVTLLAFMFCVSAVHAQKDHLAPEGARTHKFVDGPGNDFIEIYLSDSGQFSIGTTGGDPANANDDNKDLIYGHPNGSGSDGGPWSSFSTFRIDGTDYFNTDALFVSTGPVLDGSVARTTWYFDDVSIAQNLSLVSGTTTGNPDAVRIEYVLTNSSGVAKEIGLRLMLDTMLGSNDGAPFWISGMGGVTQETEFTSQNMPQFYQVFDDLSNPAVHAEGTLLGAYATSPDRFVIGQWGSMTSTEWDYTITGNTDIYDSALAIWWDPITVQAGASRTVVTFYGLAGVSVSTGDLTLGVTSPNMLERDGSDALYPNPFDVTAFIQNASTATVNNVEASLDLPSGLSLSQGSSERSLGTVSAGAQETVSWQVTADESLFGTLSFTVHLSGDGITTQDVTRSVVVAYPSAVSTDGDWTDQHITLYDTPEAAIMVRTGDIDNLGWGWPDGFNPFSGQSTPMHYFPWTLDPADAPGTDRIMVVSSYNGSPPRGQDGYTSSTVRPDNNPEAVGLDFDTRGITVTGAVLQLFADDFQAPAFLASYQVWLDGVRASFMEPVINSLLQSGPIGKLISFDIPEAYLGLLADGHLDVFFDDVTTGAGDGYAIDFVKLLINPGTTVRRGTLTGLVREEGSGNVLAGVDILVNGRWVATSGSDGTFSANGVTAGLATVQTQRAGYGATTQFVDIVADGSASVDCWLESPAPQVTATLPLDGATGVDPSGSLRMEFDQAMTSATLGAGSFILSSGVQTVGGAFTLTDTSLEFVPDGTLTDGTYTATLSVDAQNTSGVAIWQPYTWSFSVGVGVATEGEQTLPEKALLVSAYPNPFNNRTTLTVDLGQAADVTVTVYSVLGRKAQVLDLGMLPSGLHSVPLEVTLPTTGVMLLRVQAGAIVEVLPVVMIK